MAVHTDAETVLSLADLKTELGVPADDAGFDSALTGYRAAALNWIGNKTRRAVLRPVAPLTSPRFLPTGDCPLVESPGYDLDVIAETPIRYWGPDRKPRESPDRTITLADLGRVFRSESALSLFIYPPAAGWPEDAGNNRLAEIDFAQGWNMNAGELATVRNVAILFARGMFTREERHFVAARRLIRPVSWM